MIFYPLVLYVYELTVLRILFHFDADPGHGSNLKNGNGIKIGLDRVFDKKRNVRSLFFLCILFFAKTV